MINYFLQQQLNLTPQAKKIIRKSLSRKRKYQPFHIDCSVTKKKICYCINNPVININIESEQKQKMWQKYQRADDYFMGIDPKSKQVAQQHFDKIKSKIQSLSRKEVVAFVKSIQQEKNLMGELIQY